MSYNHNDELYHYGVKGMKWGHRKAQPFSAKATGHRIMAKAYGINANYYEKRNSRYAKQMAGMQRAAQKEALKRADTAQAERNAQKANNGKKATNRTISKVSKQSVSSLSNRTKAAGQRVLAKAFEINANYYSKRNSSYAKQMAGMQRAAQNEALKRADELKKKR